MEKRQFHDKTLHSPPFTETIVFERRAGILYTNVPHLVVHHSPNGFELGYGGSGPADTALNICEAVLRNDGYAGRTIKCFDGECFMASFVMHQEFKRQVVENIDRQGGRMDYADAAGWVQHYMEWYGA